MKRKALAKKIKAGLAYAKFVSPLILFLSLSNPTAASEIPHPPTVKTETWQLIDHDSGKVLAEHDADKPVAPASLTKLMTAYLLFEKLKSGKLKLNDTVRISDTAWKENGSRLFLRPGTQASAEDLIKGMLVRSANDATIALVEYVYASEKNFVVEMNQKALTLGLRHTRFTNATGHDEDGHLSTARDLSRLTSLLIRDFPSYYLWFAIKEFTLNQIKQYNHNALLWRDASVDGVKTGQTRNAGFCLITSASRDHMRLIATVLGAKNESDRVDAAEKLIDYGFRYFETRLLYEANAPATHIRVWMGNASDLPLGVTENLYLTLPRGWHRKLSARLTVKDTLFAPIHYGQKVGTLALSIDQQPITEYPLVALSAVKYGNFFQRRWDEVLLWLQ